jgi:hypothetical protein
VSKSFRADKAILLASVSAIPWRALLGVAHADDAADASSTMQRRSCALSTFNIATQK